jgi:hypothetical protein
MRSAALSVFARKVNHVRERLNAADPLGSALKLVFNGLAAVAAPKIQNVLISDGCLQIEIREESKEVLEVLPL